MPEIKEYLVTTASGIEVCDYHVRAHDLEQAKARAIVAEWNRLNELGLKDISITIKSTRQIPLN